MNSHQVNQLEFEQLKKENQELKTHNKILINQLNERINFIKNGGIHFVGLVPFIIELMENPLVSGTNDATIRDLANDIVKAYELFVSGQADFSLYGAMRWPWSHETYADKEDFLSYLNYVILENNTEQNVHFL